MSYLTGTCYSFELGEFLGMVSRRAGLSATAGHSCWYDQKHAFYVICVWARSVVEWL